MTGEYRRMYPREWNRIFPVQSGNAYKCIKDFWTEPGYIDPLIKNVQC